jgi:perosamine synthetase
MNIPIFNTYIDDSAALNVTEVLKSTFLSEGQIVKDFENKLKTTFNTPNFITLNSGTSALHLALVLAGVGEGDEVIIPAQTFVATGIVVIQQKAKIVFADIDYETGNISVESLKRKITSKTKAVIVVHWGGYPCDMDEINQIAKDNNIIVIEDAAHAIGAEYKGNFIGNLSDFTCFSFQAIKHLTTGDGGAIVVKDQKIARESEIRKWFGIDRFTTHLNDLGERNYNIELLGFKYHMNNYSAALGISNLNGFLERMKSRVEVANYYRKELNDFNGINLFECKNDRQSAYWLFGFHVENRIDFIKQLKENGITASVIHQRIDRNKLFGGIDNSLENQRKFDDSQIHIPIHDAVDMGKAEYIVDVIKKGW